MRILSFQKEFNSLLNSIINQGRELEREEWQGKAKKLRQWIEDTFEDELDIKTALKEFDNIFKSPKGEVKKDGKSN